MYPHYTPDPLITVYEGESPAKKKKKKKKFCH